MSIRSGREAHRDEANLALDLEENVGVLVFASHLDRARPLTTVCSLHNVCSSHQNTAISVRSGGRPSCPRGAEAMDLRATRIGKLGIHVHGLTTYMYTVLTRCTPLLFASHALSLRMLVVRQVVGSRSRADRPRIYCTAIAGASGSGKL